MMKALFCCFFLHLTFHVAGQLLPAVSDEQPVKPNTFYDIQREKNQYYLEHPGEKGEKIWKRREWFLEPRLYPSGEMQNLTQKTFKAYHQYLSQNPTGRATHAQWSFCGPFNITYSGSPGTRGVGRINSFAIHPSNANIIYVGTANGGIWKSTNGGTTWANISPNLPLLAVSDIVLDPNNPNIVYVLTGDGEPIDWNYGHETWGVTSVGVIKSSDAGVSWYPTGFFLPYPSAIVPNKLLINPYSADTQFVAHNTGLIRTTDNWETYTTVFSGDVFYDIEYHPGDTKILYCSGITVIRRSLSRGAAGSWSTLTDPDFSILSQAIRIELAVTPDLPTAVYAMAGGPIGNATIACFRSLSSGAHNSWTIQDSTTELLDAQTFYNLGIVAKDTDYNDVFVGGVHARRSYTGGLSWTQITSHNNIHGDVHDIQYRNGVLYFATDGGLYKSNDDGTTWTDLWQGLGITEIYRISGTPQNANLLYCGAQDNGIMKYTGTSTFTLHSGGDGIETQINFQNPDTVYWCLNYGDCNRTLDGWNDSEPMRVPSGPHPWVAPMIMDPVDPKVLFVARDSIFRSDQAGDSTSWIPLGKPMLFPANCLQQGNNNRNRLYASQSRNMFRTDSALTTQGLPQWTNISAGLPDLFITGIAVHPGNANLVYVSLSGYSGGQKVYVSANGGLGGSWVNISGSIPNIPVNCIAFHANGQNGLYIGTDIGVFYRDNTINDWIYYSNGLPSVVVNDLHLNTLTNEIFAGTYGRGMWKANLYAGCDVTLTLGPGNLGGHRSYSVSDWIVSSHFYHPDLGTQIHYSAGNHIDLKPGFRVSGLGFFEGRIGPCPSAYVDPLMTPDLQDKPFLVTRDQLARIYSLK